MSAHPLRSLALLLGAALAAAACERAAAPLSPVEDAVAARAPALEARGLDAHYAALERQVPGFGGYVYGRDGTLTVTLTDLRRGEAARAVLVPVLRARRASGRDPRGGGIRVRQGRHAYGELRAWQERARGVLSLPGVAFTDADEAAGRLRVGVAAPEAEGAVRAELERLGVPAHAVEVSPARLPRALLTLRDSSAPDVPGGFQLSFVRAAGDTVKCSLGFNYWDGFTGSYVTNSHCTAVQGGVEGTNHHQPLYYRHVGTEAADPAYFTGGACPAGRRCRYSDAARFVYSPGWFHGLGLVARTTFWGTTSPGSLVIAPDRVMSVVAEKPYPVVGETLDKMGRGTGWTYGAVSATCVDVNVAGSDVTLLCQDVVDAAGNAGDSGATVFLWRGTTVDLAGVLWGGTGTQFYFSAMWNIEYELGPLQTF